MIGSSSALRSEPPAGAKRIGRHLEERLRSIVGKRYLLTADGATRRFRIGYRTGGGSALAVVRPGTLIELWRVAHACVEADASLIIQAANTGLTGGSTPCGDDYPGGVVIVSTTRISRLHVIRDNTQVICLAGTTLHLLERSLAPHGREPHSVIGSSCIGASVVGGICNNSGGSLIQRGPAFTQMALYGVIEPDRSITLVNHLGIALGDEPEEILGCVEAGAFTDSQVEPCYDRWGHDRCYSDHVREIDSGTPARFNADPRRLFETAGSAGKLIVFAVRLDSFPVDADTATFYIGTSDPSRLTTIRREILKNFASLPVAGEYLHRDAFDVADRYGKDTVIAIERLGTGRLPLLLAAKARLDALAAYLPFMRPGFSDRMLQRAAGLLPDHLPPRMRAFRDHFEHHLILKVSGDGVRRARELLSGIFPSEDGDFFECTLREAEKAFLHRFAAAGAAVRYRAVHDDTVEDVVALDVALPRNASSWTESLPTEVSTQLVHALYYGHFFCHVFHQDYIVRKGCDPVELEHRMWASLDARGAEYPAEHNVGHLYAAKPALVGFYRSLDARNQLNPGIGRTTRERFWGATPSASRSDREVLHGGRGFSFHQSTGNQERTPL